MILTNLQEIKALEKKTGKKTGGQKGHKGISMSIPHDADEVKKHIPNKCKFCPNLSNCISLGNVFACGESRYVVEAVVNTHVIEHQSLKAVACPLGDIKLRGEFPEDVKAHVQYGKSFTVLASILNTTGAVSISRIQELLGDLFGVSISQGTIISMVETCAQKVSPIIKVIKQHLISSEVVNFDETGVRALGSLYWVHNASNSEFTYQSIDKKRGLEGIKTNEVSVVFKGIAVHDCWASYWNLENIKEHAVCCVHLLRELNGVIENEKVQSWASRFKQLLITIKQIKDVAIKRGKYSIEKHTLERIDKEYDSIMSLANIEFPPPQANIKQRRGRIRKGKSRALIERLIKFKKAICLFLRKFDVPYDNNQAERDIRNVKTKIKVSGCFRSKEGAQNYLTIMSFISTAKKHGIKAFEALNAAFNGNAGAILVKGSE